MIRPAAMALLTPWPKNTGAQGAPDDRARLPQGGAEAFLHPHRDVTMVARLAWMGELIASSAVEWDGRTGLWDVSERSSG